MENPGFKESPSISPIIVSLKITKFVACEEESYSCPSRGMANLPPPPHQPVFLFNSAVHPSAPSTMQSLPTIQLPAPSAPCPEGRDLEALQPKSNKKQAVE